MDIKQATTQKEKRELDRLLWTVLWEPLNLPRNIRNSFKLGGPEIDLIAIDNKIIVGALVANWLSEKEIEIRHLAVKPGNQENSVGSLLVGELFRLIREKTPLQIHAYARNTSLGFFTKLGFKPRGNRINQPNFMQQGLWLQEMYTEMAENDPRFISPNR
ncbi:GNAT family N-acetyltransferase [Chloroflexota bacterium]